MRTRELLQGNYGWRNLKTAEPVENSRDQQRRINDIYAAIVANRMARIAGGESGRRVQKDARLLMAQSVRPTVEAKQG